MAELRPGQIEIGGLVMGRGCDIEVAKFEIGDVSGSRSERGQAAGDGRSFGLHPLLGRTISIVFCVNLQDPAAAGRAYAQLAAIWNDPNLRLVDDARIPLRFRAPWGNPPTRVVYGRPDPEHFASENDYLLQVGRIDVVADFDTTDPYFYADPELIEPVVIPITPPVTGVATFPLTFPLVFSTVSEGFGEFGVGGTEVTPLVARIHGPLTTPVLDYLGYWKATVRTSLLYDQWIDIDARPHVRTIVRSDGLNLSGVLEGPPLSDLVLYPGPAEMVLRGLDPTGTARLVVTPQAVSSVPYFV